MTEEMKLYEYELLFARYSTVSVEAEDEETAIAIAQDEIDIEGYSECGWYYIKTIQKVTGRRKNERKV